MDLFEKASKLKLRFDTPVGIVSSEDLWDIPLTGNRASLDDTAKDLNRKVKESEEESFVAKRSSGNAILNLKLDIVKHIIKVKLEEVEKNEKAVSTKAKKQKIMEIMASKADANLEAKSTAELQTMLDEL